LSKTPFQPRKPRFQLRDHVLVTVAGIHRNRPAVVVEVIQPRAGDVYRYKVRFPDGTTATFFGFELNDTRE
jgi:hypothetical protein